MKARNKSSALPQKLRARAEQRLRLTARDVAQMPAGDMQKLVHELQIHQIELEMKNDELRRTQQELERVRDRYADLYDSAPVTHLTLSAAGEILEANLCMAKLLGLERSGLIRQKFTRFISAEAQNTFYLFSRRIFHSDKWQATDLALKTAQGKRLLVHVDAVRDPNYPQKQCRLCCTDITERKRAEERIAQLDRAKAILGGVDRAIVHMGDQQKLLDEICRIAVEQGGFKLAWVGMISPDRTVQAVAKAGETGYLDEIRVWPTPDDPESCGPVGMAIRENRPVVIGDIEQDTRMIPWRDQALKFGLRYAAVFPIQIAGQVAGSFHVYAPKADSFSGNELALLTQVGDDISFALTAMAALAARKEAEEQLSKLSRAVEQSPVSIVITDLTGAIEYVNPKFTNVTGYAADEVRGKNPRLLKSGEMPAEEYQRLWQTITQGREWRGEFHNRKKNGELYWEAASIHPIKNDKGVITHFVAVKEDITDRKLADVALQESEARFRQLTEATHEGICFSDKGKICDVNDQLLKMFGYERHEMIGKTIIDLVAPDSRAMVAEAIHTGREVIYEHQLLRKEGSAFYAEAQARMMRIGNRMMRVTSLRDITERKQAEEALRRSQQRYVLTERAVNDGLWDWNILTDENCFSPRWKEILGYRENELPNHKSSFLEKVHPDDRAHVNNVTRNHLEKGERYALEFRLRHKDGSYRWVFSRGEAVRDATGRPVRMVGAITDISERKQAELTLIQSEERFSRMFKTLPIPVALMRLADGLILDANETFLRTCGYTREEAIGHTALELNAYPDPSQRTFIMEQLRQHGHLHNHEQLFRTKSGQFRNHLLWIEVISISGEQCMLVLGLDITERKEAEAELRNREERYRQLFELGSDAILVADQATHRILDVNRRGTELYGYSRDELLRLRLEDVSTEPEISIVSVDKKDSRIPLRWHRKKNGERIAVEINANFFEHRGRELILAAVRDVTARLQAEESVRENEARFQQLANSITDVFWIVSPDLQQVHYVSPAYEQIWGRTVKSLYANSQQWAEAILPEDRERVLVHFAKLMDRKSQVSIEYRVVRPDGSFRWVLDRGFQVLDPVGKLMRLTGVASDVTERKQMEVAISAERERLEHEVLRRIEKEQERIGRDLHDGLCQALVGAKYRIGVLGKRLADMKTSSAVAAAKAVEQMINRTIQQARDLAKGLNPVKLQANGLVFALEELAKEVESTGIAHCNFRMCADTSISDRNVANHLYRITQEAVQNAIKHGKARKISIALQKRAGQLVLSVEDNGAGFLANPEKSVGAGLHNMKMRASMIGGALAIRPGRRGGSVISVSLPAEEKRG